MAEKELGADARNEGRLFSLGLVQFRAGKYEHARATLGKLSTAEAWHSWPVLAMIEHETSHVDEGQRALARALKMGRRAQARGPIEFARLHRFGGLARVSRLVSRSGRAPEPNTLTGSGEWRHHRFLRRSRTAENWTEVGRPGAGQTVRKPR